ncbi:MAG: helix-turn-helix domain-containing protein, partial [Gomphosphaeria aponina SAG 52.96 = DSM 107014]|nr:helix-turn-helix domain-containing protein [Gomphosphaeria aponina SAG 52.96 = DSM 107014]
MSLVSFKTSLRLNNKQKTLALKHAGTARHAYNWGLNVCLEAMENQEKIPTSIDLHKKLVKEVKSVHQWYYEVSKCAPQEALRNLDK